MTNEQIRQLQAAVALQKAGRLADAASAYKRVLDQAPGNFDCTYLLATLYAQQGQINAAIELFRRAARIRPDIPDVQYNLAVALGMSGGHAEAARIYKTLLKANPRHSQARHNYAASLLNMGDFAEAARQYDELVALHPDLADGYANRGMALQYLNRFDEALESYDKAIALRPAFAEAHVNRGNVLAALRRPDEALASYNKAIALKPDFADAYSNAGNIYCLRRAFDDAIAAYDRGLALRADDAEARSMRLFAKLHLCDWSNLAAEYSTLTAAIERGSPTYPFIMLAVSSSPADQLRCASIFAKARYPLADKPLWRGESDRHDRLRIAYVSADFRSHAVSHLTAGMFECHDKSQFEINAISIGPDEDSELRRRLKNSFDRFIDANAWRDDEIAARIGELEIDILVDLNGFTQGSRMGIFAQRPAPIQVAYLGYSGTVGADYFDYIIADPIVIPKEHFQFYSEKVAWLPDSFMVNDDKRKIAEQTPSRRDLQLPDNGFVFCCFNQPYKIGPQIFDVWMRLLQEVDGSVLWLKDNGAAATRNLRREASHRGIAPERLVFAPATPLMADHLARHRQADLFLDTLPYNAHATTGDALWAGLPVVTCLGTTFAGRVAASLLKAVGLDELVTTSLDGYEALALKLARTPSLLAAFKARLERDRGSLPLFDTARFTRHIEAAYLTMHRTQQSGLQAASFAIHAAPDSGNASQQ